jgi:hypothetical protein
MKPLLSAAILAVLTGAASAQVPTINIDPSCRAAAAGAAGLTQDFESCRKSELAARDTIAQQWNDFPAADRSNCHRLTTIGTPGTYTEMLTCLEMKRDARRLPASDLGTVGLGGTQPQLSPGMR